MKILIIEDEVPQALQLKQYIVELESTFMVMNIVGSIAKATAFLREQLVDLIFLDIHLADGLCFDIFEKVEIKCPVIFTTAYDKYAIQAFKYNGIDYLLKPVDKRALKKSIEKFKLLTNFSFDYGLLLNSINELSGKSKSYKKRFVTQVGKKLRIISNEEIAYFYAFSRGVYIKTQKNENLLIDETLEFIESEVDPYNFFRLNRKVIAHVSAINEIIPYSRSRLKIRLKPVFEDDVIVSYKNVKSFMIWIKK